MFHIARNKMITLERGDYGSFLFKINLGTPTHPKSYIMSDNDTVFLGVTEPGQLFENALIKKVYTKSDFTNNVLTIEFDPSDTILVIPGTYYYEIKLRCLDEETKNIVQDGVQPSRVYTIQPKTKFIILE